MPEEQEKPRKYQTLETSLHLGGEGSIDFNARLYSSSDSELKVGIWDGHNYIWKGTAEEFWSLIQTGIKHTQPKDT